MTKPKREKATPEKRPNCKHPEWDHCHWCSECVAPQTAPLLKKDACKACPIKGPACDTCGLAPKEPEKALPCKECWLFDTCLCDEHDRVPLCFTVVAHRNQALEDKVNEYATDNEDLCDKVKEWEERFDEDNEDCNACRKEFEQKVKDLEAELKKKDGDLNEIINTEIMDGDTHKVIVRIAKEADK